MDLNNKSILITGGTGSFGKFFSFYIAKKFKNIKKIVIYSRDELKQFEMSKEPFIKSDKRFRFFLGDIRDKERLKLALKKIDIVIHAAALKQVPASEYNPFEFIKTNVLGSQNLIYACLDCDVKKVIALSTDKAAAPVNLYGATKLCSDKLFSSANNIIGNEQKIFTVVRYGNVMASRGSIIPEFFKQKKNGYFTITDKNMTRFNITLKEASEMVLWSLKNSVGGEILVPKIPSFKIIDLAKSISKKCKIKYIGIRPGEKLHEEMITASDSYTTYDLGKYFAIVNPSNKKSLDYYKKKYNKIKKGKSYNSLDNDKYLSDKDLKELIKNLNLG
tara:strand:+ start:3558 stop:4553 length:996 start_codon:yes stop_codon:yes gene_type:complete